MNGDFPPEVPPAPDGFDRSLKLKTRRAIGWMFGETLLEQSFSFFVFILMARVLPKEQLGTFAIVFVLMDTGRAISRAGVFERIAREKQLSPLKLDTIFWINVALGCLFALAMVAFARAGQVFFSAPRFQLVTQFMAAAVVVAAAGNTHMALRLREFGHRTMATRSLAAAVFGAAIAVAGVLAGYGIWAFVAQRIAREVVVTLFAWRSVNWRPRFAFDWQEAREDLAFGREIVAAQLVGYLSLRGQDLIVAKFLGPVMLSTYRVAWRSAELLGPQLVSVFSIVSVQTFSRLQDHPAGLRTAYCTLLRNCSLLCVPALIGYGVSGPWLVPAIFGPQWQQAGQLALVLAFLAVPFQITYFFQSLMAAVGHAKLQRHVAIADMLSALLVGAFAAQFGLTWVVIGYTARAYVLIPLELILIQRHTGISARDHLRAFGPSLTASLLMGVSVALILNLWDPSTLILILAACFAGAAVYAAALLVIIPDARRQIVRAFS